MRRANKLTDIAKERHTTVENLVKNAIEKEGGRGQAALALGVSPAAIDYHLRKHGLQIITWAKVISQEQAS